MPTMWSKILFQQIADENTKSSFSKCKQQKMNFMVDSYEHSKYYNIAGSSKDQRFYKNIEVSLHKCSVFYTRRCGSYFG